MNELTLTFPALAGIVATLATSLISQSHWGSNTKRLVSIVATLLLIGVGVWFHYVPAATQTVLANAAIVYGVSQVVYAALKPTGLVDWVTDITSANKAPRTEAE